MSLSHVHVLGRYTGEGELKKLYSLIENRHDLPRDARATLDGIIGPIARGDMFNINADISEMFLRGVDSRRDTAEQIEKGVRIFPQFLEDRYQINDGEDLPLLVFLVQNLQSVSFIPTIVNLAKEFDHVVSGYSEGNRWGLLDAWEDDDIPQFSYSDLNVLKYLVLIGTRDYDSKEELN